MSDIIDIEVTSIIIKSKQKHHLNHYFNIIKTKDWKINTAGFHCVSDSIYTHYPVYLLFEHL